MHPKQFLFNGLIVFLSSVVPASIFAGGPPTVGTIDVVGDGFSQTETDFVDVASVYFLEINYDGVAPLVIDTNDTTEVADTELGLYDATGNLVANDDDGGNGLYSVLSFQDLPAGQYFLAVGLFNTIFGTTDFDATSSATGSGNVVVKVTTEVLPITEGIINIPLNYNFNGIVHFDEDADPAFDPDHPNGYRSISDRGLDFRMSIPSNETVDRYSFVLEGAILDLVHLGNRNTVDFGNWAFDDAPDLDANGIQPDWLADPDQSGRQTTDLPKPYTVNTNSQVQVLFNISNGGGSFDVVIGFTDGSELVETVSGPDWFGPFNGQPNVGIFDGAFGTDFGFADPLMENTILLTEAVLNIGSFSGQDVTSLSFENATNLNAGVAVYAANFAGLGKDCLVGDVNQDGIVDLLDVAPFVNIIIDQLFQCEADINQDGVVDLLDVQPLVILISGG